MVKYPMRSRDFTEFSILTLASLTAIVAGTKIDNTRLQGCDIQKLRYAVSWAGKTAASTEGPLAYGVCKGMTVAEVANFYAADPQSSKADDVALMESQFPIVEIGRVGQNSVTSDGGGNGADQSRLRHAKWGGWKIIEGTSWNHYVFNANPNDPMATGMLLQLFTEVLGEWLAD